MLLIVQPSRSALGAWPLAGEPRVGRSQARVVDGGAVDERLAMRLTLWLGLRRNHVDRAVGALAGCDLRKRDGLQQSPYRMARRNAVRNRVVAEHEPMPEDVGGNVQNVLRQYVVPSA